MLLMYVICCCSMFYFVAVCSMLLLYATGVRPVVVCSVAAVRSMLLLHILCWFASLCSMLLLFVLCMLLMYVPCCFCTVCVAALCSLLLLYVFVVAMCSLHSCWTSCIAVVCWCSCSKCSSSIMRSQQAIWIMRLERHGEDCICLKSVTDGTSPGFDTAHVSFCETLSAYVKRLLDCTMEIRAVRQTCVVWPAAFPRVTDGHDTAKAVEARLSGFF